MLPVDHQNEVTRQLFHTWAHPDGKLARRGTFSPGIETTPRSPHEDASRNKCIASSNKCLTSSNCLVPSSLLFLNSKHCYY